MSIITYIVKATEKNKIFRDVFNMQSIRFPTRLCLYCVISYIIYFHSVDSYIPHRMDMLCLVEREPGCTTSVLGAYGMTCFQ